MSLGYCGSCGETVEGRFCRMCGARYLAEPAEAVAAAAVQSVQSPYQQPQALPTHRPTPAQPVESDFESLFRPPEGQVSPHGRTQVMRPVEADYRMPPPPSGLRNDDQRSFGAAATQVVRQFPQPGDGYPPGPGRTQGDESADWNDDEPGGMRRPVVWATLAAVAVASAVILGLLYIGSHNTGGPAGDGATNTPTAAVSASQSVSSVDLAPGSASPSTSASASASPSASLGGTTLPLSIGSTGQYVHYVQTRLRTLGYYHGSITGRYDQATAQAVSAFQDRAGVTADPSGTVGQSTLTAMIAAGSQPSLRLGQRSGDVRRLQEALNAASNAGLTITGRYDAATFAAVGRYQQQVGVSVTGSMNKQTWEALQSGQLG